MSVKSNGEQQDNSVLPGHRRTLALEARACHQFRWDNVYCRLSSMRSFVLGPHRTFQRQRSLVACPRLLHFTACIHCRKRPAWGLGQEEANQIQYISQNMIQWCNIRYMFIIFANCCLLSLCLFLCCLKVGGGQAKTRCQRAHISPPSAAFRSYEDEAPWNHWKFDSLPSNLLNCHNAQQP